MKEKIAETMMEKTKELIRDEEFQKTYIRDPMRDFVRTRKIGFPGTMIYVLGNSRESLEWTSEKYADAAKLEGISGAAISKAREKINWPAFRAVFEECAALRPVQKTYHGYELIATDGMKGVMPNWPALKETYPVNAGQGYPMFHCISAYDMLNETFLAADFRPAPADEREMAIGLLQANNTRGRKAIWLFDRGFPSVALIQKLEEAGQFFVMRVSSDFIREVNDFVKGKAVDKLVTVVWDAKRAAGSKIKAKVPYTFTIRCLRVQLDNETEEILITNLSRHDFPKRKIKELYSFRWGVETAYNYLKHAVFIEEFTSKKENGIKQDFYASLWAANLTNAAIADAMTATVKKKLNYKANRRNAVKSIYRCLFALFFSRIDRCRRLWTSIRNKIKKSLSAVRPGRHFSRTPNAASHSCVHSRACLS